MIWIELIGPSGVGKSYWYQKFIDKYPEFEPKQIVLNRIYLSSEYDSLSWKHKFMFKIYRMNIYRVSNHLKHKLFSYFLKTFQRKSKTIFTQKNDDTVINKYLQHIDALNEPQIIVLKKIAYFNQKLTEFKFYQFYLDKNDIYIAEDGLMHLSPVFINELQADKILIFEKDYNTLLEQRLQRAKTKPTAFIEFIFEEEDLKNYIENYYQWYDKKIESITQGVLPTNVKTIDIDKQDVIEEMYQWITQFKN